MSLYHCVGTNYLVKKYDDFPRHFNLLCSVKKCGQKNDDVIFFSVEEVKRISNKNLLLQDIE